MGYELGQAQTGQRASTPKTTKLSGDDRMCMVYRNMGNNHAVPYIWADQVTMVSGATSVIVCSGIKFHGYDVATYGNVVATAEGNIGYSYITKDTVNNVVTLVGSSAAGADVTVNVQVMLGVMPDLAVLSCRGNNGASQSLP